MMNKKILFCFGLIAFWGTIVMYIVLAAVPLNPLSLKFENSMNILSVVPEGWGFFTRNPREPSVFLYKKVNEDSSYSLINSPNSSPGNLFGLSRSMRKINLELFSLLANINDSVWQVSDGEDIEMHSDSSVYVRSSFDNSKLRGSFLVLKCERLPWAWANKSREVVMPCKKINLNIY